MNPLQRLAQQTAVYGLSNVVGRVLNYLLVPLYTRVFVPGEYGVVTELYAYVSFLIIVFTYGMETAFFRFSEKARDRLTVYSTALLSLAGTSLLFSGLIIAAVRPVSEWLQYVHHPEYIIWFALILGLDAIAAVPFARLRLEQKAVRYAVVKLTNIGLNIGLNLFFLVLCPYVMGNASLAGLHPLIESIYDPSIGVGYVFIANLAASGITLLLLLPELRLPRYRFETALWQKMMRYAAPLVLVGLAGMVNETIDRILLKHLLPYSHDTTMAQIGIYGACYKLSILMTLFVQAFRLAAEPFFFSEASRDDARRLYARVMTYFVIAGSLLFLVVTLYLDIFKHFIGAAYHDGLHIVPILLVANLFLGIFYNLSVWYKLTDRTGYGAVIAVTGAVITIGLNIWWIPAFGYTGAAWATLVCYVSITVLSYFVGRTYYPVSYPLLRILAYIGGALGCYLLSAYWISPSELSTWLVYALHTGMLTVYAGVVVLIERQYAAD